MQDPWQTLREALWPSRSVPRDLLSRREALLHMVVAMAIAVAAGPEIVAALEMSTLLELLGVSLFMTAFTAGAKLVLIRFWRAMGGVLLPLPQLSILHADAPAPAKAAALVYVSAHAAWCVTFVFITGAWGHYVFQLL